jgi:hypothetical protein
MYYLFAIALLAFVFRFKTFNCLALIPSTGVAGVKSPSVDPVAGDELSTNSGGGIDNLRGLTEGLLSLDFCSVWDEAVSGKSARSSTSIRSAKALDLG